VNYLDIEIERLVRYPGRVEGARASAGIAARLAGVRLACLPLFWRYRVRPELRDLKRSIRPRMLATLVPLALLIWLAYAAYFLAVYDGQITLPVPELRWSMLGSFALAFALRTGSPRSAVLFHASTPVQLAASLRLQALANSGSPLAYATLFLACSVPAALHAFPVPLMAARYLAADVSMLALIVSHLSVAPVLAGLRRRARLAWAGAVLVLLGLEVAASLRWEQADLAVVGMNVSLLAATWGIGSHGWNPVTLYRAVVQRLARSQRAALAVRITGNLPAATAVYARELLLTPGGLLACAAGYGLAVAAAADLSANGMPASGLPATLMLAYLATVAASGAYLTGVSTLPFAFYKLTPVSFARLTGSLVVPHVAVLAPITLVAMALELANGGSPPTLGTLLLQMIVLPLLAWLVAMRHLTRSLLAALLYGVLVASGLVAALTKPLLFAGLCVAVPWILFRGASARYLAATAGEWPEPHDPV
jgi:hypothetical protein